MKTNWFTNEKQLVYKSGVLAKKTTSDKENCTMSSPSNDYGREYGNNSEMACQDEWHAIAMIGEKIV